MFSFISFNQLQSLFLVWECGELYKILFVSPGGCRQCEYKGKKIENMQMTNLGIASFICKYNSSAISRKGATSASGLTDWVPKNCFISRIFWTNDLWYNVDIPGMESADAKVDSLTKTRVEEKFNEKKKKRIRTQGHFWMYSLDYL